MPDQKTRVIRAVFQSPPNPDRFSDKEWCRLVVVVLFPEAVKRRLATAVVAKDRAMEIARQQITDRLYNPPNLIALVRCQTRQDRRWRS